MMLRVIGTALTLASAAPAFAADPPAICKPVATSWAAAQQSGNAERIAAARTRVNAVGNLCTELRAKVAAWQAPRTPAPPIIKQVPIVKQTIAPPAQKLLTDVRNPIGLARLRRVWGLSLQWVDMSNSSAQYGKARSYERNGYTRISGEHRSIEKGASITLDGDVIYIEKDRIMIRGTIKIVSAPNDNPNCERTGDFVFESHLGRKYWRLYDSSLAGRALCSNRRVADDIDIYF